MNFTSPPDQWNGPWSPPPAALARNASTERARARFSPTLRLPRTALFFACALATTAQAHLPSPESLYAPPDVQGAYDLKAAGELSGQGNAAVASNKINLNISPKDASGSQYTLVATGLELDRNRFYGSTSFRGNDVRIAGRIEYPDPQSASATPRLSGTIALTSKKVIRFSGSQK